MKTWLLALAVVAIVAAVAVLTQRVRQDRMRPKALTATAAGCTVGMIGTLLSDWPSGLLSTFWVDHPVWASLVSSTLLVATMFMVYEQREATRQRKLAKGLSAAGAGGIVEHLIDIEIALGLLSASAPPAAVDPENWSDWDATGKPLRWLRNGRAQNLSPLNPTRDPRLNSVDAGSPLVPWGPSLIDQSIRCLLAAMRDWAPLVGTSIEGTSDLLLLSAIRRDLMDLHEGYVGLDRPLSRSGRPSEDPATLLVRLRTQVRLLALSFETWSGAIPPRPEVLVDLSGLPGAKWPFDDGLQPVLRRPLGKTWGKMVSASA